MQTDPRGVLAAYETKMLDDDTKVESLALGRTTGEQGGQQRQPGGDSVDSACVSRV
jgi:hypothetical protein